MTCNICLLVIYLDMDKSLVRVFKIRSFDRWSTKVRLYNKTLRQAVVEIEKGQYEANLGGCLYKKRIALGSKGKSGGIRTIIAFKKEDKAIFIYGFSKNQKTNITSGELLALKKLSKLYFGYTEEQIKDILKIKEFIEVE